MFNRNLTERYLYLYLPFLLIKIVMKTPFQLTVRSIKILFIIAVFGLPSLVNAADLTVTTTDDELVADGDCSLREAIESANNDTNYDNCGTTGSGADRILLPSGTYTISLVGSGEDSNATGDFDLLSDIKIEGLTSNVTIDAAGLDRVFHSTGLFNVEIVNVTIRGGNSAVAVAGGGLLLTGAASVLVDQATIENNHSTGLGGGFFISSSTGLVTISNSIVSGNSAESGNGGGLIFGQTIVADTIFEDNVAPQGGGLSISGNDQVVQVTGSTLRRNHATGSPSVDGFGGGLNITGANPVGSEISQTTINDNTAEIGAGLMVSSHGISIVNSTISGNVAKIRSGGFLSSPLPMGESVDITHTTITGNSPDGLAAGSVVQVSNSIIAENDGADCIQIIGGVTSLDYNIDSDGTCGFTGANDQSSVVDVGLFPLADYGLSTMVHALQPGSPAIDAGDCAGGTVTSDQITSSRPGGAACDVGAFEHSLAIVVNETADELNTDGDCSLREAIQAINLSAMVDACSPSDTILLPAGVYTISIVAVDEDANAGGDFDILNSVRIYGAGRNKTIIDGAGSARVFDIVNTFATFTGVQIRNGLAPTSGSGGGVRHTSTSVPVKSLRIIDSLITNNASSNSQSGGGIYSSGALFIESSSFISNQSVVDGGGVFSEGGSLEILRSEFVGNSSGTLGGGISSTVDTNIVESRLSGNTTGSLGGGIFSNAGNLNITSSTLDRNSATNEGSALFAVSTTVNIVNTTVSGNLGNVALFFLNLSSSISNSSIIGNETGANYALGAAPTVSNTIIGSNSVADCGALMNSVGFNIDTDGTCNFIQMDDQASVPSLDLMPLQNYSGPTMTHGLLSTSPALNAGDCSGGTVRVDQRGVPRPDGSGVGSTCDIGAFESNIASPIFSPASLSGMRLWLDANDAGTLYSGFDAGTQTCNGTPVAGAGTSVVCWADKSGNNSDVGNVTASQQPVISTSPELGNLTALEFDRTMGQFLENDLTVLPASNWSGEHTSIFVYELVSEAPGDTMFSTGNADTNAFSELTIDLFDAMWNTTGFSIRLNNIQSSGAQFQVVRASGVNLLESYAEGRPIISENTPDGRSFSQYRVGVDRDGSSFANARIAEILIYDRPLSGCEMTNVMEYLGNKYGRDMTVQSPGGAASSDSCLEFWVKSDTGVIGSPSVSEWLDQSGNSRNLDSLTGPSTISNHINFHNALDFNGLQSLTRNDSLLNGKTGVTIAAVVQSDETNVDNGFFFTDNNFGNDQFVSFRYDTFGEITSTNDTFRIGMGDRYEVTGPGFQSTAPQIWVVSWEGSDTPEFWLNGERHTLTTDGSSPATLSGTDVIALGLGPDDPNWNGQIMEFAIFDSKLNSFDIGKLQIYLATKYGISLKNDTTGYTYGNSRGEVTFPGDLGFALDAYDRDVAGIMLDPNSGLDQRISRSGSSTAVLTVGHGNIADFSIITGATHTTAFTADWQSLFWGHDSGATNSTTFIDVGGTGYNILDRRWAVYQNGNVGDVSLEFDLTGQGLSLVGAEVALIRDDDGDLSSGATALPNVATVSGDKVSFTQVDFDDGTGDFFALAINQTFTGATLTLAPVLASYEEDSADPDLEFSVTLSGAVPGGFDIAYTTNDGTATAGNDYADNDGTLNFAGTNGEVQAITISALSDDIVEGPETLTVSLGSLSNISVDPMLITVGGTPQTGTITNDDTTFISNHNVTVASNEDDGDVTIEVRLTNAVEGGFTIEYFTDDMSATLADGDYTDNDGTLMFDGTAGEVKSYTVSRTVDSKVESDESALASFGTITLNDMTIDPMDISTGKPDTIDFDNDDAATISINDASITEGDSAFDVFTFTVTLDNPVEGGFTVQYLSADGTAQAGDSDYTTTFGTLTFAGTAGEQETFTSAVHGDQKVELDEQYVVNLQNLMVGALPVTIADGQGEATITNNDTALFTIDDVTRDEGNPPDRPTLTFTVTLDKEVDQPVSVNYATSDGSATVADGDYVAESDTMMFAGTAGETQLFTVTVNGDDLFEADEQFNITLTNPTANMRSIGLGDDTGVGTIQNDDPEPTVTLATNLSDIAELGGVANITATLLAISGVDTTVNLTLSGTATSGSDYVASAGTNAASAVQIVIPAGDIAGNIVITSQDDSTIELDETVIVTVDSVVNAAPIAPTSVTVTILDDEATEDDDNDGISNIDECPGGEPCPDSDGDGTPDSSDDDSDNDGTPDKQECTTPESCPDGDGDGIPDHLEPGNRDTDGDGIPDSEEVDADGDGKLDSEECPTPFTCSDNDGDGIPDNVDPDDETLGGGDSDKDGIPDTEECPDGVPCPDSDEDGVPDYLDAGESIESPFYFVWNSALDQVNINVLFNTSDKDVNVDITVYDLDGNPFEKLATDSFIMDPRSERDIVINDRPDFGSSPYGLVCVEFDVAGSIDGHSALYRHDFSPGSDVEFAIIKEFQSPINGTSYTSYNTSQPSRKAEEAGNAVYNWLQIANFDKTAERTFEVNLYSNAGALLETQTTKVPPLGRRDLPAGDKLESTGFGLVEIIPENSEVSYSGELFRYGSDAPMGMESSRYHFAIGTNLSQGRTSKQIVAISEGGGGENYLEVSNLGQTDQKVLVEMFGNNGQKVYQEEATIIPMQQRHFPVGIFLGTGNSGIGIVTPITPEGETTQPLLVYSTVYFQDSEDRVTSAYSNLATSPLSGDVYSLYNTYFEQFNWLRLFNISDTGLQVEVEAFSRLGDSLGIRTLGISPFEGADFELNFSPALDFKTGPNTFGLVRVKPERAGALSASGLRAKPSVDNATEIDLGKGLGLR